MTRSTASNYTLSKKEGKAREKEVKTDVSMFNLHVCLTEMVC